MAFVQQAFSISFTITSGQVQTFPQYLFDGDTSTIEAGGELNTVSTAINVFGINNTVANAGHISTTGKNGSGVFLSQSVISADITNMGDISTLGEFADGIKSWGTNTTIANSGNISTSGRFASGIHSWADSVNITNSGSITITGREASGILTAGPRASIINNGSITITGDFASGVWSADSYSTIINNGSILTTGLISYGIWSSAMNTTINNGSISTIGDYGHGIYSGHNSDTILNNGSVSTIGDFSYGIISGGSDTAITNSGSIVTLGDLGYGIVSFGTNTNITNSGSILTNGDYSKGIWSTETNANITNRGSISTTGRAAQGIESRGNAAIITNNGSISTTGFGGKGILLSGDNANITNSGNILTTGILADGIYSNGGNATITNNGSISTVGSFAHGIYSRGADTTINNRGLISATGNVSGVFLGASNPHAILGSSNDITLNLFPGSQIIGLIDLGDDGGDLDTVNIYGGNSSANLTFENTEVINLFGAGVVVGNRVIAVDSTGESTRGVALAKTTSAIHNVINQRMAHTLPLAPSRTASTTHVPGALFQERKPVGWVQFFGGESERDSEGEALEYEHDYQGFTLGYERDYDGHRLGFMGGVVQSETETDTSSFKTETDSYYLGAYGHINLGPVNLTTALIGGYSDSDNKRVVWDNLNGREVAKSDLDGLFISPSVTLSSAYPVNNHLELRPSASVNYSVAWLDRYREHGTTNSNMKVDDRTSRALSARLQLAAAYKFSQRSEIELRAGMNSRHTDDDDIDANLAGSNFRYGVSGDEDVTGRYAGLNIRFAASENLSLIADIEFGRASGDEDSTSGHLTLEYRF